MMCSDKKLFALGQTNNALTVNEARGKLQVFLDRLNYSVGMCFVPSKFKVFIQGWVGL